MLIDTEDKVSQIVEEIQNNMMLIPINTNLTTIKPKLAVRILMFVVNMVKKVLDFFCIFSVSINGNNYIGVLYIPSLNNLSIPIIRTCSENNLKVSCCRYAGSISNNNMVIAGHNYIYSFGQLNKLNNGNIVYFKDINGNTYKYKCKEVLELNPEDVYEMQTGDWDLTLFTCTYTGQKRLTLRFELDV